MLCGATCAVVRSFAPTYTPRRQAERVYRRVSIQLMPVASFGAAREHRSPHAARRASSARWATLGLALVALAVGVLLAQVWQTRRLSAALETERARAAALQQTLSGEALAAEQRRAALEQDLRAVEGEA